MVWIKNIPPETKGWDTDFNDMSENKKIQLKICELVLTARIIYAIIIECVQPLEEV